MLDMPPLSRALGSATKGEDHGRADDRRLRLRAGALHRERFTTTKPISATAGCASGRPARSRSPSRTSSRRTSTWSPSPTGTKARRSPCGPIAANAGRRSASGSRTAAKHGPDRRLVRRSVALQAQASFRRREHPPRLAQHRRPAGNAHRRITSRWSTNGSRRRASFPDERRLDPSLDRVRRGRPRLARDGRGPARDPAPRPVLRRQHELDQVRARRRGSRRGFPGHHARPARAWAQRQAA